jgi:hypothetical protein
MLLAMVPEDSGEEMDWANFETTMFNTFDTMVFRINTMIDYVRDKAGEAVEIGGDDPVHAKHAKFVKDQIQDMLAWIQEMKDHSQDMKDPVQA